MLKREVSQEELDQLFRQRIDYTVKEANVVCLRDLKKNANTTGVQGDIKKTLKQEEIFKHFKSGAALKKKDTPSQIPLQEIIFKETEKGKHKKKHGKTVLGLDIGFNSIKLTILEKDLRASVIGMEEINGPSSSGNKLDEYRTVEGITRLLTKNKIKKKDVAVCLSERYLFLRTIKMMKMNKKELERAVEYEARRQHIPYKPEEISIKYSILREIDNGDVSRYEVLLAAVPNDAISRITSIVRSAGLRPIAIDIDSIALLRFIKFNYQLKPEKTGVFIHMGQCKTLVTIIKGEEFLWAKDIAIGGKTFADSIADYLMVDSSQAESLKKDYKDYEVFEAMKPVFDQFIDEIRRILEYCIFVNTNTGIDQIILSGEAGEIAEMKKMLSQNLGVPAAVMKISPSFDLLSNKDNEQLLPVLSRFAVSLGLSLWNKRENSINLMPEKGRKRIHIPVQWIRPGIMITTIFIITSFVILLLSLSVYFSKERTALENDIAEYLNIISELKGIHENMDRQAKLKDAIKDKKSIIEDIKRERALLASPLNELSNIIPRTISVLSINFNNRRFIVKGLALDNGTLERFFQNLHSSYHFDRIENIIIRKKNKISDQKWSFEVTFDLKIIYNEIQTQ